MNKNQRAVLICCACVVVAMLVYPPHSLNTEAGQKVGMGYYWINEMGSFRVDVVILGFQWIAVLIVGGLVCYALKDK